MSSIKEPEAGREICLRCPGGRLGTSRLRAFIDTVENTDDLTVMVSRRQALVVRGAFDSVPTYLLKELTAEDITGENVKTYPYVPGSSIGNYVINQLSNLSAKNRSLTFSYSPHPLYRGNLRLDDFSFHRITT